MNMKKATAAILIMVILVSSVFAGCKKKETEEEKTTTTSSAATTTTTTTTAPTATTPTTATTAATATTTTATSAKKAAKAKIIKTVLTAKDKKNLSSFLAYFIDAGSFPLPAEKKEMDDKWGIDYILKYSYRDADATDVAYAAVYGLSFYNIFDELAEEYGWKKDNDYAGNIEDFVIRTHSERDPQKKLEITDGLIKIKADKLDEILETVFNVKPDRSYKLYDYRDGDKKLAGYYDNGWFYANQWDGGDGAGPLVKLKSIDKQSDGKYIVKAEYLYGDSDGYDHVANFKAEVALKDYNGDRIWSIYSMEKL